MKKQLYTLAAIVMLAGYSTHAQETKKSKVKEEKQEVTTTTTDENGNKKIVIEKKINDGKPEKTVIVIDGENVTINGKPAKDFKGDFNYNYDFKVAPSLKGRTIVRNFNRTQSNKALLGVNSESDEKGAKIVSVIKETAADKAGVKEGDIITSVNNDAVSGENNLAKLIGKYKPEETVDITVLRDGKEKKLKTKLGKNDSPTAMNWSWNGNDMALAPLPSLHGSGGPRTPLALSFGEGNFFRDDRPKYGFSIQDNENGDGVKITNIKEQSNAEKAGLKKDDLVTELNGNAVKNTDELKKRLAEIKDKTEISMKVLRNGSSQSLTLKVPKKIKTADL